MEQVGISWPLLAAQLVNIALVSLWIVLALMALRRLRGTQLPDLARAIWAALIVLVPLLGALAFLIARPQARG
jgi:uncharacterized membrane protein YhaH (DUF805 family)